MHCAVHLAPLQLESTFKQTAMSTDRSAVVSYNDTQKGRVILLHNFVSLQQT